MKKNMLFLSAAITTFILVILASVFFKARAVSVLSPAAAETPTAASTQAPSETPQPSEMPTLVPTATSGFISPQEAVSIASKALGNTQIYSIDTEFRYGKDAYKVTFSSGHIVYINPQGVILAIDSPQAPDAMAVNALQSGSHPSSNPSPSSGNFPTNPTHTSDDGEEHSGWDD